MSKNLTSLNLFKSQYANFYKNCDKLFGLKLTLVYINPFLLLQAFTPLVDKVDMFKTKKTANRIP